MTVTDPPTRLLRFSEVKARSGLSRSHVYRLIAEGRSPKQSRLSHRVAVWREADIDAWVASVLVRA